MAVDIPILASSLSRYTDTSKAPMMQMNISRMRQQHPPKQLVTSLLPLRVRDAGY